MTRFTMLLMVIFVAARVVGYETTVSSDEVRYDGELITLSGHVTVENDMGCVTAEQAFLHKDEEKITRIDFPWIDLKHDVCLTLSRGGRLECKELFLDYTKKTSLFVGNPQVVYKDEVGEIYADRAQVDYTECNGTLKATKVVLTDHIRLVNLGSKEKPASQFALADEVLYFPEEQSMVLQGKQHPVLFYDQLQDMQLSAYTVRAQRDLETKKESVQGVGDVHFIFRADELNKLKEHFNIK